ncbi:VOC family protein [uncultured Maritalea sp.]|uniref:VOC family protein n=1 Tax=uncultured Maritalea sp. TaxID=757249 RepID=UPI002639A868|nr:VOC family protein [uncultured Maritalea sp.]
MEQRASLITLGVRDLAASCQFYQNLGWQMASNPSDDIVAFNLQGSALALYGRQELAKDAHVEFADGQYSPFTLAQNVISADEVDTILAQAQQAGGKLIKPGQTVFWGGYSGYFADPDSFLWEVAHNPFSGLGPNGEFRWGGHGQT